MEDNHPSEFGDNLLWSEGTATRRIAQEENWQEREWQCYRELCAQMAELDVVHVAVVRRDRDQDDLIGLQVSGFPGIQPEEEVGALAKLAALRNQIRVTLQNLHRPDIREKLRDAVVAIREDDNRPVRERLWSAWFYSLSSLQAKWFPPGEAQDRFVAIEDELSKYGEATEGAGSVPSTLSKMGDDKAVEIASQILALADRYSA